MKKTFIYLSLAITLFSCKKKTTEPTINQPTTPNVVTPTIGKPGPDMTDIEGNTYKTVIIGTQQWMAENLRVSKYNDGTPIPNITDNQLWGKSSPSSPGDAWCYYNNDASNNAKYGKLYSCFTIFPPTNGNKDVCPIGWHIPTDAEWKILTDFLGGVNVAGGKMKETGTTNWNSPNTDATNTSLFTGLPGGYRSYSGGFSEIGNYGYWWSSTQSGSSTPVYYLRALNASKGDVGIGFSSMGWGLSIRCIKD